MQLIDRYGDELEFDLRARLGGMDLQDWFHGRYPWGLLLRLAERLPQDSQYKAALYDDDEVVQEWVRCHGDPDDQPRPALTLAEWTPERAALVSLTEAVMAMHRTLIAVHNKGKAPEVRPLARPRTAWDRVARTRNIEQAQGLIVLFSPAAPPPELAD